MRSAPHRANILRGTYHEIGIGTAPLHRNGMPTVTYTTDFGSRGQALRRRGPRAWRAAPAALL